MWADKETDLDFLNFSEVASITADLIRRPTLLPLSIGIFGNWGSGKSSMLRLIEQDMLNKFNGSEEQSPFLFVNFDAWLYQDFDDARAALMETIGKRLLSQAQSDTPVAKKALKFLKRVNYFRAIGSAMDIGAAIAFGIPPVGIAKRAMDALGNFAHGTARAEDVGSLKDAVTKGKEAAESFLKPEETTTPPEEITAFRKEFAELLTNDLKKTLVVFVDNLDRCLPAVAINTLEAIRLFLFLPNTAFVIAADEDMIRLSVEKHFDGLSAKHVTDYLDKLIQVPIRVPRIGTQELRAYMFLLLISETVADVAAFQRARTLLATYLRNSWKGDKPTSEQVLKEIGIDTQELRSRLDLADRLAPVLASAPNVMGNPRIVKRLFNTIMMRAKIAKDHAMPIDEALLAKLAVFERCTDEKTTGEFLQMINNAPEGKAEIFTRMEDSIENEEKLRELMPTEWAARHWDFIAKWLDLEPKLGGRDLRGALYLSRETVAFSVRPGKMSAQAADGVAALMKVQTMSSPNAAKLVKNLTPRDQDEVMTAIIAELHKIADWTKSPSGFSGAVVLADANESITTRH
jgi:predicted KAP-like P-loop ATPase